ncbi:MAG: DUF6794 domain-containing protein [Saprospiraceae bacterium]
MKNCKWLLAALLLLSGIAAHAQEPAQTKEEFEKNYQQRIRQEVLYGQYIPKDLNDAFVELSKRIDAESKAKFKSVSEDEAVHKLYFSLGRWIIENWGFYGGSRLSHYLREMGIAHPEDMAQFIIVSYHRSLNRKELKIKEQIEHYQEKRKKEYLERVSKGQILHEETRKVNKN